MLIFNDYIPVAIFVFIGFLVPVISIVAGKILSPNRPNPTKVSIYECGEIPVGEARLQFGFRYYMYALMFVIFDVETVFLYPWAIVFLNLGFLAFVEMMLFIGVLVVGLAYAWGKGALKWI